MKETKQEKVFLRKLGGRIQELRLKRGMSQERLAHKVGISRVYEGYIEQGRSSPAINKLYRMAKELKVEVRDFFSFR